MSDISDFIDTFESRQDQVSLKAIRTTKIENMPEGKQWDIIKHLYNKEDAVDRMLASQLNALFTEGKVLCIFSKRTLTELLKSDENIKRTSANSKNYKLFFRFEKMGIFKTKKPMNFNAGKYYACAIELIDPVLRGFLEKSVGKERLALLENSFWSSYEDGYNKKSHDNGIEFVSDNEI